jgi:hypothetical protein
MTRLCDSRARPGTQDNTFYVRNIDDSNDQALNFQRNVGSKKTGDDDRAQVLAGSLPRNKGLVNFL